MQPSASESTDEVADDLVARFNAAWSNGEPTTIERFLAAAGGEEPAEDELFELIYTEVVLREQAEEFPTHAEYRRRFPEHADRVGRLFEVHEAVRDASLPGLGNGRTGTNPTAEPTPMFGNYELLEEVGRGGMGIVYRARHNVSDEIVALKVIRSGSFAGEEEAKRFQSEVETASRVRHPGLVPIIESGECGGMQYLVMEFIDGSDLAERVEGGPLESAEAARIIMKVAEALHAVHESGIIHRDLKPHNVLIDAAGQPRLTDFGVARLVDQDARLTSTGQIIGTPGFMPPEQVSGKRLEVDVRSDVYALGGVLYFLLTGRAPFSAKDAVGTLLNTVVMDATPPRTLNPRVDPRLERICLNCLEKDPKNRYGSALELADELIGFLAGRKSKANRGSTARRAGGWLKRYAWVIVSVSVIVVLFAALIHLSNRYRESLTRMNERDRREKYNLQLHRAAHFSAGDPQHALKLLDDTRYCPESLRDFTWRYLRELATRNLADPRARQPSDPSAATVIGRVVLPKKPPVGSRKIGNPYAAATPAFSGDGQYVAYPNNENGVSIAEVSSGRIVDTVAQSGNLVSMLWSEDDRTLHVVSAMPADGSIAIRGWRRGRPEDVTQGRRIIGRTVSTSGTNPEFVILESDGAIVRYNLDTQSRTRIKLPDASVELRMVAIQGSTTALAVSSPGDRTRLSLNVESKDRRLGEINEPVTDLALSSDTRRLIVGTRSGRVEVWNCKTGQRVWSMRYRSEDVRSVTLAPDAKCAAVCYKMGRILLVDPANGEMRCQLRTGRQPQTRLGFSPDGQRLTLGIGGGLLIWRGSRPDAAVNQP